ncbi:MAG: hypothetical protein HQM11_02035 [SAR324 cluster bacterium]|nr:hypothetical protein [SAR324 cluster bacterium]
MAQETISINDELFDRFYRASVTETTTTPGHLALNLFSSSDVFSSGVLAEYPVFGTNWILAPSVAVLSYKYHVPGLGDVPGLNQALGLNFYMRPVRLNIYTGYNVREGKNVPMGDLPSGVTLEDFKDESKGAPYLYFRWRLGRWDTLLDLNFASGSQEVAKTYLLSLLEFYSGWKAGFVFDRVYSTMEYATASDPMEIALEYYQIAGVLRKDFALSSGVAKKETGPETESPFGGYYYFKFGEYFGVNPKNEESFEKKLGSGTNFLIMEMSYWYTMGICFNEDHGTGYRFGVNYAIGGNTTQTSGTSGDNSGFYDNKKFWVTFTYQNNYIMENVFGTRIEAASWLLGLSYN